MKSFFSNLKIKDWALIILVGFLIVTFVNGMLTSSGYKRQIKDIENRNDVIEEQRKSLESRNIELSKKIKNDSLVVVRYQEKIDSLSNLISIKDGEIKTLKRSADNARKELEKTKKEIDNLLSNPIKRTGDELIKSLKEKTKNK
jgi:chromosome segregation ATPase